MRISFPLGNILNSWLRVIKYRDQYKASRRETVPREFTSNNFRHELYLRMGYKPHDTDYGEVSPVKQRTYKGCDSVNLSK